MNDKNIFLIEKDQLYLLGGLLIYKLVLDFVYVVFVHKLYAYSNFTMDFNFTKYIVSFILLLVIYLFLPKDSSKTSSIIILLHFMIMVMPMITLYAMKNESTIYLYMVALCFIIECIIVRLVPDIKVIKIKQSKYIFYFLVVSITAFVYSSMIYSNGLPSLKALNVLNAYDVRGGVKYPFLMNYLVGWQAKTINPIMIATSYKNKKNKTMIIFIVLQLTLYLITGNRSFLFTPIAILIVMYIFRYKYIMNLITITASAGCLGAYLTYLIGKSLTLTSLFVRRFLFVPAQIKFFFYDFISKNKFLHFSEGIIGKIIKSEYPYDMNFVNLISDIYFKKPNSAANTGYLGSGYANLGFKGILIYTIILTVILILIDSIGRKSDKSMITGIAIFSLLTLNDSDLLTTLLTGGLLFLIVLLYLYVGIDENNELQTHDKEDTK